MLLLILSLPVTCLDRRLSFSQPSVSQLTERQQRDLEMFLESNVFNELVQSTFSFYDTDNSGFIDQREIFAIMSDVWQR